MSIAKVEAHDHPSHVLRTMAAHAGTEGEAARLMALAAALEQQYGQQNNAFQVALGLTDLDLRDAFAEEIMQVRVDLATRMDILDERHQKLLEFLEELQQQVRSIQGGGTPS